MPALIPLTGQISDTERHQWIDAINKARVNCNSQFKVVLIESLTAEQKHKAKIAVVADPDPSVLTTLPNLVWIQSLWAGVENLAGTGIGSQIKIVRLTDPQMAETMAEAVLAWTFYLHRDMPRYRQQQSEKRWQQHELQLPKYLNVTVFGLGKLGTAAALRLQSNGFTVRGWSNSKKQLEGIACYHGKGGFGEALKQTDVAVILLPLTNDTSGLFDESALKSLRRGGSIINFARGPILIENDLLTCLNSDHLDHAVLDVFNQEPPDSNHPFWSHNDITMLPHISAPTTIETAAGITSQHIDNYLSTGVIPQSVDRQRGY